MVSNPALQYMFYENFVDRLKATKRRQRRLAGKGGGGGGAAALGGASAAAGGQAGAIALTAAEVFLVG